MAIPLFVAYEVLIWLVNAGGPGIGLGVEVFFKRILMETGQTLQIAMSAVLLIIGIGVFIYDRRNNRPIVKKFFVWMILESAVYAVVLGVIVGTMVASIFNMWTFPALQFGSNEPSFLQMLTLSIGAGLYEELFFRVILVGGLFWFAKQFTSPEKQWITYIWVAIVGALIFSWVHYTGNMGDAFTWPSFTFRFLMGLAFNALFLLRGFGIAAWTHSLYDIMVTMMVI